ncbi:MAG: hypothetical protein ABIU30_23520 [Ferruginibacter sp.]
MKEINPKNLSAQLAYKGVGNPPGTHPSSSISNCFPGLEFDFRAIWKNLIVGVELHESNNMVVAVDPGSDAERAGIIKNAALLSVNGNQVYTTVRGPMSLGGPVVDLAAGSNLEWTNALANILQHQGGNVDCLFDVEGNQISVSLKLRILFDETILLELYPSGPMTGKIAEPGELTQGLCSPWQADYRECGCYYWAASRPDFVNAEESTDNLAGDNWMQKIRGTDGSKQYKNDAPAHENPQAPPDQWTYEELYRAWEKNLKFIIGGKDENL